MTIQPANAEVERTEILYGIDNVVDAVLGLGSKGISRIDACVDQTRPSLGIEIQRVKKAIIDAKRKGLRTRLVTEITKDNISHCKELLTIIGELRHLDGIKGTFYLSERQYLAPAKLHEKGKPAALIIYSNVKEIVEHQQYVFDSFWSRALPAEERIRQIEEGTEPGVITIIRDYIQIQELGFKLVKSSTFEILTIFSTANAFRRLVHVGAVQSLVEAAERGVKVRLLMPIDDKIRDMAQKLVEQKKIDIRYTVEPLQDGVSILIVDKKFSLVVELKDDSKDNSLEASGLATYSNSKPTVLSYVSIFESLWKETELHKQLKESNNQLELANKQLKAQELMQREFINIAAHELRSPIQPILTFSKALYSKNQKECKGRSRKKAKEELVHLDIIIRNAKRLKQLTSDVLDVTKIESQRMELNKTPFNLNEVILNVMKNYRDHIEKINGNLKLIYENREEFIIVADKARLTQVISNLLSNSVKFTKEGTISIRVENKQNQEAIVSIRDTGKGVNPEILPRLFTKFATRSYKGTGLGLFISKSIIEAHGGKMWAEKYANGEKGATFTFSLPLINKY